MLLLVDLAQELGQRDLRLGVGGRGLLDLASSTRERIRACVDDRAEAMRGQLLDVTSWPPLAGCHEPNGSGARSTIRSTSTAREMRGGVYLQVRQRAPGRIRTCATSLGERCSIP